mgnify:CR=1 FL=1
MSGLAVCTLAHGRADHLANLVRGLSASRLLPELLVVSVLQPEPYELPPTPFPVRQLAFGERGLSLAEGRNAAAAAARAVADKLIFLDVDCIPHPDLTADYYAALDERRGVMMGEVAYLPKGATDDGIDVDRFDAIGVRHSERRGPPDGLAEQCSDHRCFWSLNFAMRFEDWQASGGFDERYRGYGGEDTDFGRQCAARGLPLWWVRGARVWHQYHPHHMPPVHHLDSVLANAAVFAEKWGEPTMQHWLRAFVLMGLARREGDRWVKLRDPAEADLALTRQQADQPYASSATVLERLEAEAMAAA